MATASQWLAGTRPRTLPAAVVPVLVGSGVAVGYGGFSFWRGALGLVVALALQVGVNYANDYSDGIRDTDAVGMRVGPLRLVGSGLAAPGQVKLAAFGCFGVAATVGLALAAVTSWWLVPAGVSCVLGAWCYTGGPRPYGYMGLGEVAVFVFFGWWQSRARRRGGTGPALITALGQTSRLQIAFGIAFTVGLAIRG